MPLLEWTDKMSVGVGEIDNQHKKLIHLINAFHDAIQSGKGKQVLENTLSKLADYTVYHFQTEEKYIKQFAYDGYVPHKVAHDEFTKKVLIHQVDLKENRVIEPDALMAFLRVWVTNHIMDMDRQYSEIFIKGGLK
jgi:hemerythrin